MMNQRATKQSILGGNMMGIRTLPIKTMCLFMGDICVRPRKGNKMGAQFGWSPVLRKTTRILTLLLIIRIGGSMVFFFLSPNPLIMVVIWAPIMMVDNRQCWGILGCPSNINPSLWGMTCSILSQRGGCEHQQMVSKVSDCTDVSGEIRQDDCIWAFDTEIHKNVTYDIYDIYLLDICYLFY